MREMPAGQPAFGRPAQRFRPARVAPVLPAALADLGPDWACRGADIMRFARRGAPGAGSRKKGTGHRKNCEGFALERIGDDGSFVLMCSPLSSDVRVLVADDDPCVGTILHSSVVSAGATCELVESGSAVIRALERAPFDVLVADIGMPGNHRLELVQQLSERPQAPAIILLTGNPTIETAARAVGQRVAAYLTKPIQPAEFLEAIRNAWENTRACRAVLTSHERLQKWTEAVAQIQQVIDRTPNPRHAPQFEAYLNVTMSNLVGALGEFAEVADVMVGARARTQPVEAQAARCTLEEVVDVLEKTRRHFHSKELGTLRRKVEQVLAASGTSRTTNSIKYRENFPILSST